MVELEPPGDAGPAASDQATTARIRAQVDRITASVLFARSGRLCQFLRFSVESKLSGNAEQLKESIIGVQVYGRDPSYDPKLEPIVRTEARRLRAKLKQYYEGPGKADLVVITLPTGGYSIHVEIVPEPLTAVAPQAPLMPVAAQVSRKRPAAFLIALLSAILVIALTTAAFLYRTSRPVPAPTLTPVATYPGAEFQPSVSPDGQRVAFVWDQVPGRYNIYIKGLGEETATQLTTSTAPTHDLYPAWSPDGKTVAFVQSVPNRKELYVQSVGGGAPRRIAEFTSSLPEWTPDASLMDWSPGPSWTVDGRSLVIADRPAGQPADSLYLLSPKTGEKRKLTSPPAPNIGDFAPALSPDGRNLAFIRLASLRGLSDLYVLSLDEQSERRITFDSKRVSGVSWLSNHELVFSSNRGGPNALWRVSTRSGGGPIAVPSAGFHATNPVVLPGGRALVFTQAFRNTYIWRADLSGPNGMPAGPPTRLIGSQGLNDSAQYSPDGSQIAWVSDRSGTREIWLSNADGSSPRQLTRLGGLPVGTPRWSPDSRQIAVDSVQQGRSVIDIVNVDTGQLRLFAADASDDMMPSWSHDQRFLYFLSRRDGTLLQSWKKAINGGPEIQVTQNGGGEILESPDGRNVYYSRFLGGIWQLLPNGREALLPCLADVLTSRHVAVTAKGIFYLVHEAPPWEIAFYSFATRQSSSVLKLDKAPAFGTPSLAASPDGRFLTFSELEQSGTNLQLLRDF